MTKCCIYSKRPLQFQIKSGYNHKGIKFRGVAPQFFVFFHIGVPPPPGNSSCRDFCQYSHLCLPMKSLIIVFIQNAPLQFNKKAVTTTKDRIFGMLPHSILYFFILPPPLTHFISRQVGFLPIFPPLLANKMIKYCIYLKHLLPITKKKRLQR